MEFQLENKIIQNKTTYFDIIFEKRMTFGVHLMLEKKTNITRAFTGLVS